MNISYRIILFFGLIVLFQDTNSQDTKYRKYKFEWDDKLPAFIPVEEQFREEDAVILVEETKLTLFYDEKLSLFYDDIFEKHIRIKYLTEKGIRKYSEFVLPESFDPISDYRDVVNSKRKEIHRPMGDDDAMIYFVARIIKPDGSIVNADIKEKIVIEDHGYNYVDRYTFNLKSFSYVTSYAYGFKINNVSVNDEVEIFYKYKDYYPDRIFFNSSISKQNFILEIIYPCNYKYVFKYQNNAQPNDSIKYGKKNSCLFKRIWERKNLTGCINEPGARPYKELSNINLDSQAEAYLRYSWPLALLGEVKYKPKDADYKFSKTDKRTLSLNKFYAQQTKDVLDSNAIIKFNKIHQIIVDEFAYQDDFNFYIGKDIRLERIHEFLEKKILRDISRFNIYGELLDRLRTDYYKVIFHDKRIEEIKFDKFFPSLSGIMYYCIPNNGQLFYFPPKKNDFGYYINEMPFYLQATPYILVPQTIEYKLSYLPDAALMNKVISKFLYHKTPNSTEFNNIRVSNVLANVSLDSSKVTFDAKLKLLGQFSTMQRGYYQYNYIDSTVNPKYHQMISDIEPNVKLLHKDLVSQSKDFPFECNLRLKYLSGNIVNENPDGSYSINLQNWFNHIIYEDFSAKNRVMSFYPDFRFQDSYSYYIKFDHNIEVLNAKDFEINITNALGRYMIKLTKMQPNVIRLKSIFKVLTDTVEAKKVSDVEDIYSEIQDLNNHFLKIKIVN